MNELYLQYSDFDLMSKQFLHKLVHLCLLIFFLVSYSVSGSNLVSLYIH